MSQSTATIHYGSTNTDVATILVATFESKIYTILLGNNQQEPLKDLKDYANKHLKKVELTKGDKSDKLLHKALDLMQDYLNSPTVATYKKLQQLPLYIEGTDFQKKVWSELKHVPVGKTVSYSELAKRIDSPKAFRAVASACAHNRHGIVIPCHRVLRSDGGISGYRWGIERKKKIIALEKESIK